MQDETTTQDLKDRLALIEAMIAEGRQTTESWGSTFVLWGIAFYAAMAWTAWGQGAWAWPITMAIAVAVTVILASVKRGNKAKTVLGRSIGAVWVSLGISMFALFIPIGSAGRLDDPRLFIAVASAMLGMANASSALILRWKIQIGCAVIWWVSAMAACFLRANQATVIFFRAIFVCYIAFGIYGMIREGGAKSRRGAMHA